MPFGMFGGYGGMGDEEDEDYGLKRRNTARFAAGSIANRALEAQGSLSGQWSDIMPGRFSGGGEDQSTYDTGPQTAQAQFIDQRGNLKTGPADISQSFYNRRGQVQSGLIDARAPVAYGGKLSAPSLSTPQEWASKFAPSTELQSIAASRRPEVSSPWANIRPAAGVERRLAQDDEERRRRGYY